MFKLYQQNYHKGIASKFKNVTEESEYYDLVKKFEANTTRVAAYKAYHATKELKSLVDSKTFATEAKMVLKKFNRFQAAEYNSVVARSRSAKQFVQFQNEADIYPNMEWITTRSADPREEHLAFVGIVLPIDDPFWSSNQPGDLWNCKCDWQQTDKPSTGGAPKGVTPSVGLEGNPAETGELITDQHPYFTKASNIDEIEAFIKKEEE